jgi:hypothetical protein
VSVRTEGRDFPTPPQDPSQALVEIQFGPVAGGGEKGTIRLMEGSVPAYPTLDEWLTLGWVIRDLTAPATLLSGNVHTRYVTASLLSVIEIAYIYQIVEVQFVPSSRSDSRAAEHGTLCLMEGSRPAYQTLNEWLQNGWTVDKLVAPACVQGTNVRTRYTVACLKHPY